MPYVWYSCSEVCLLSSQLFRCLPCVQLIVQRCVLRWDSSLEVHLTPSTVIQRCVLYSVNCPDVYFTSVVQRRVLQPVNRPELCLMSCQLFRGVSCVQSIVQRHVVCQVNWLEVCLMSSQLFRGVLYVQSVQCFVFHCVSYSQVHLTSSQLFRGLSYIPLVVERCVLWQSIVQRCVLWQSIIQRYVLWQSVVQSVFCDSWFSEVCFTSSQLFRVFCDSHLFREVFCDSHLFRVCFVTVTCSEVCLMSTQWLPSRRHGHTSWLPNPPLPPCPCPPTAPDGCFDCRHSRQCWPVWTLLPIGGAPTRPPESEARAVHSAPVASTHAPGAAHLLHPYLPLGPGTPALHRGRQLSQLGRAGHCWCLCHLPDWSHQGAAVPVLRLRWSERRGRFRAGPPPPHHHHHQALKQKAEGSRGAASVLRRLCDMEQLKRCCCFFHSR